MRKKIIGAFGSSTASNPAVSEIAAAIGGGVRSQVGVLYTGACTGYPYDVAQQAYTQRNISYVVGISPFSRDKHPSMLGMVTDHHDLIIYTGLGDSLEGKAAYASRNKMLTDNVDVGIVFPGTDGTMLELDYCLSQWKDLVCIVSGMDTEFDERVRDLLSQKHHNPRSLFMCSDPDDIMKRVYGD